MKNPCTNLFLYIFSNRCLITYHLFLLKKVWSTDLHEFMNTCMFSHIWSWCKSCIPVYMCKSLFPVIYHGWESTCSLQILIASECSSPNKLCVLLLSVIVAFYNVLCVVYFIWMSACNVFSSNPFLCFCPWCLLFDDCMANCIWKILLTWFELKMFQVFCLLVLTIKIVVCILFSFGHYSVLVRHI